MPAHNDITLTTPPTADRPQPDGKRPWVEVGVALRLEHVRLRDAEVAPASGVDSGIYS